MGFLELLLIAIIGLVVVGPKRLPETVRMMALWIGRIRRMMSSARTEMEKEFGVDEVRQQLHNEQILKSLGEPFNNLNETDARKISDRTPLPDEKTEAK